MKNWIFETLLLAGFSLFFAFLLSHRKVDAADLGIFETATRTTSFSSLKPVSTEITPTQPEISNTEIAATSAPEIVCENGVCRLRAVVVNPPSASGSVRANTTTVFRSRFVVGQRIFCSPLARFGRCLLCRAFRR